MTFIRIIDLTVHLITARWTGDPAFTPALHSAALVRVVSDGGMDGWGEITLGYFLPEAVPPIVEFFKPLLVGRDAMNLGAIAREMYDQSVWWARQGAGRSVISGIEMALWDLQGKTLNIPAHQLMGGAVRERVPVYASGGASLWPIEQNVKKLQFYANNGYRAAKLSTGFYESRPMPGGQTREEAMALPFADSIRQIAANFAALRREMGPGFDLAIDGHQGGVPEPIPVSEAIEIAAALAPHRLRFYEEPLAYSDVDGYAELRARSPIPIAGGESLCGLDQFHPFIERKALHIVQPDVGFVGGVSESVRIIHHAEASNLGTAIHTGGAIGPGLAASWHLAAAHASVQWLEHVVAAAALHREFLLEPFSPREGTVGVPSAPGLGLKIDLDMLEKWPFVAGSGERT